MMLKLELNKFFRGLYPRAQIQQGREREWGRAGVERRGGEGKEIVEGMTEERERKEGMGNSDGGGGIAPLLLGGIDATDCILTSRISQKWCVLRAKLL